MLARIFAPLYLPVLQLVTLATVPATALYAVAGLLASPVIIPALVIKNIAILLIFAPFLLLTLPVAVPVGFVLAATCLGFEIAKAFWIVLTPLLWPIYFLCKWCQITCTVSQVVITDTIAPWLVPIRFTFLAAILPKILTS
eukprot:GHRR01008999.1.p1 GENE.GHRR01008999.1~~GHRR01008999.1.p1  ORF type:complete len:141 (+),score=33.23 GHRR01008999.1:406-828(+)